VLSSQIEGTKATIAQFLEYEASVASARPSYDLGEVVNHVAALDHGLKLLKTIPVSTRLICKVHRILMSNVRGGEPHNAPGELRTSQNWWGGTMPSNAQFVPPPPSEMQRAMGALEKYIYQAPTLPLLIEIGLIHAQFESIHPFIDGNGRLGRLLITFLLCERKVLQKPLLYLSHYFRRNQAEYYDRLQAVRTHGDWENWIRFFLAGVSNVAEEATQRARLIVQLQGVHQQFIRRSMKRSSHNALNLLDLLIKHPIVTPQFVQKQLAVSQPTADTLLHKLTKLDILREVTGKLRGRRFAYIDYLKLFE
jgi:Fic family protein